MAQSNAGLPELDGDRFVYTVGPDAMAEHALELRELGIDVIGACCGSSPEHLRAMAAALAEAERPAPRVGASGRPPTGQAARRASAAPASAAASSAVLRRSVPSSTSASMAGLTPARVSSRSTRVRSAPQTSTRTRR